MNQIRNILFDLGGVIMDIRKERCIEAFQSIGLENASNYFNDFSQQGPFMELERGDMTVDEFHESLRRLLPENVTDKMIDKAFCRFLIGIPVQRLRDLDSLKGKYKLYMLSNTNPIMWDATIKTEFEKDGKSRESYFDGMVTSFEANALKPEEKIFKYAESKLGFSPAETLFLDDSSANLEAASKLGFKTALVAPGREFYDILRSILNNL